MELTAKEKAKELVEKYFKICHKSSDLELSWKVCKKLALIAVDIILKASKNVDEFSDSYWEQVKTEINNL